LANAHVIIDLQTNDAARGQLTSVKDIIEAKRQYYKLADFCQGMLPRAND
jgi:hypothetical protein